MKTDEFAQMMREVLARLEAGDVETTVMLTDALLKEVQHSPEAANDERIAKLYRECVEAAAKLKDSLEHELKDQARGAQARSGYARSA